MFTIRRYMCIALYSKTFFTLSVEMDYFRLERSLKT